MAGISVHSSCVVVPRAHDAAGRTGGAPTTYTYDAAGRLTQRSDPGIVWKRTYDPNSGVLQAQSISSDPGHVLLASDAYTGFDPEGNVTATPYAGDAQIPLEYQTIYQRKKGEDPKPLATYDAEFRAGFDRKITDWACDFMARSVAAD